MLEFILNQSFISSSWSIQIEVLEVLSTQKT